MIPEWIKFLVALHLLAAGTIAMRPHNHERLTVKQHSLWDDIDASSNIEDRRR